MPPKTKKLRKRDADVEKLDPGDETIRSFFSLEGTALALKANEWEMQEEITQLVRHSRDPDPKVSLRAMSQLRNIVRDVAVVNGLIGEQSMQVTAENEGRKVVMTGVTKRLISNMKEELPDVLHDKEKPDFAAKYFPSQQRGSSATNAPSNEGSTGASGKDG